MGAPFMTPWLPALLEKNRALMGPDPWAYGVEANRKTLEIFALSRRSGTVEARLEARRAVRAGCLT